MLILWIRLKTTVDELQGKSSQESIEKAQKMICLTTVFTFTITILALANAVFLCCWTASVMKNDTTGVIDFNELRIGGDCLATFSAICVCYLVFSFVGLRLKLSQIFGKNLSPDFDKLSQNFLIMVVVFGIHFVYMCIYGNFYRIICKTYIRWILNCFFEVACEYGVILSILHLYHRIGTATQDLPQT